VHRKNSSPVLLVVGLAFLVLPACSSGDAPVPEFALMDVNPDSTTFNRAVSPRDHVGHTTAWYFGSAT
jgi:hypothetical protein